MRSRLNWTGAIAAAALAGTAFSQVTPPPATPAQAPAQPAAQPQPAIAPKIEPKPGEPTLIKHDTVGKLVRPELPPDEAALDLVGLDAGEKVAVAQLLEARSSILDHVIGENLVLLLKFQGIDSGDTPKEQMQALKDLITKAFQPLRDMGSLRDQVSPLLSPEKATKYKDILSNYWAAVSQEDETLKAKGKPMTPEQIRGYETMLSYGGEVRRSYERLVEAKADKLEDMLPAAKATPEQAAKIKKFKDEYDAKALGMPTPSQKRELFRNVLTALTYDQRIALLGELYGAKAAEKKPEEKK